MPILCIGLSHHTAPVSVRESHAFPTSRMTEALQMLHGYDAVNEAVMLQTCGRLEIYAEVDEFERGAEQIKTFLTQFRHGTIDFDLESYLYTHLGREAVDHLLRVTTGLDSMLIGEAEILGQVKSAYLHAQRAGACGSSMHKLFREALNAGKAARTQTTIGEESASVATAAVDSIEARMGSLEDRCAAVIGAGAMGRSAARRLRGRGVGTLLVANRTHTRAQELVGELGSGIAHDLREIVSILEAADVVISSTEASTFVLTTADVAEAMSRRPERPLLILDIAVPRDSDPDIGDIEGVTLLDIDALKSVVDDRLERRRQAIPQVEEIIVEYLERFRTWYQARTTVPTIAALTERAEAIRTAEIERLFARLPDLTPRERMLIVGSSLTILSKLLHQAVTTIREKAGSDRSEALAFTRLLGELFSLDGAHNGRLR